MGKRGPKRKPGKREPSGKLERKSALERIAEADQREKEAMMSVALNQPHRRGDPDKRLATALGRFCKEHRLDRAVYDAGQEYSACEHRYFAGLNGPKRPGAHEVGSGAGPSEEQMKRWLAKILTVENALRRKYGWNLANKVRLLCFEGMDVPEVPSAVMISMLFEVAVALEFVKENPHPYAG